MNRTDLYKLVDGLCHMSAFALKLHTGVEAEQEQVEGFIEQSRQVLLDYYANNELSI